MLLSSRNSFFLVWRTVFLGAFALEAFSVTSDNQAPISSGPLGNIIEKIIGGRVALPGSTPWLASLKDTQYDTPVHFCGGAIIGSNWILTAARCIIGYESPYFGVMAVVGEYDLHNQDENWEMEKLIIQAHIHPQYDYFTHNYDIALLYVFPSIDFNTRVQPLPLPHSNTPRKSVKNFPGGKDFRSSGDTSEGIVRHDTTSSANNFALKDIKPDPCHVNRGEKWIQPEKKTVGYIAGWGRTEEQGELANLIHEAYVPILENNICQAIYPGFDPGVMMCAGNLTHGGVDPCWGDWGGPMVDDHGYLAGVASWAIGCGRPGFPAVYIDVSAMLDWICGVITRKDD